VHNQFVLLASAKNEEQYISRTIQSVLRQAIRFLTWFIVGDALADKTAQFVHEYSRDSLPFIRRISREIAEKRNFGTQYRAINMAYQNAQGLSFDFISVQDADIKLAREDYYEQVISVFSRDGHLGVAMDTFPNARVEAGWHT
jgi:biofilm PGA synthesis N-glycosyltransferase PgaC